MTSLLSSPLLFLLPCVFFLNFFFSRKLGNHGEAACTGYGDRQGLCVVAFGLRDLPIGNETLVVVFLDYHLVLSWRWTGEHH